MNVLVWNEYIHEVEQEEVRSIYPEGIHGCIAGFLRTAGMQVETATLRMPRHGLTQETLAWTDVLVWWGHRAHHEVEDDVVEQVYQRVMDGMGLVLLHSGHNSKIFKKLCGTNTGELRWCNDGTRELLWTVEPGHPITRGVPDCIEIPNDEMYGERFNIPAPDELVFISWFATGEVFRSGCCYRRGRGNIFYFQPGHETFPVYHQPDIQTVITNAVKWAAPTA